MKINEPEIILKEAFISNSEEIFSDLLRNVKWDERMKARKTASFGVSYDYSGMTYPQTEMYPDFVPICDAIERELGFRPNNCLLNYYPDGNASMGYHSDSSEELKEGTGVAIISLGSQRHIFYKSKKDKGVIYKYPLKSGALLYMSKEIQDKWLHAIPKEAGVGERISLAFRHIIK